MPSLGQWEFQLSGWFSTASVRKSILIFSSALSSGQKADPQAAPVSQKGGAI